MMVVKSNSDLHKSKCRMKNKTYSDLLKYIFWAYYENIINFLSTNLKGWESKRTEECREREM